MRKGASALLIAAPLALQPFAGVPMAYAGEARAVRMGVNRLNLAWLPRDDQQRVLEDIAASGVTHVRLSLSRPVDKSIEALAIADNLGLRILLEIQLSNRSYYPERARPRPGFGRIWDIYRLSDLDLDLYRKNLREAVRRIDGLGIRLEAIEPGNEINHAAYNGDLLVYREPGRRTPRQIDDLAASAEFERGLNKYIRVLEISRDEMRSTVHSRYAAVISAGLSDMSAREADSRGMERLDPGEVVALLRRKGIDRFVEAYGIHLYPGRIQADALEARVTSLLDFCEPAGSGRPCWVTEWGIANKARSCPVDDRQREAMVHAMRAIFGELMDVKRLAAAFYYDWDTESSYSLWRCGKLSPAGAAVTSGMEAR